MEDELALRYSVVLASVIGIPRRTGRREMLDTRISLDTFSFSPASLPPVLLNKALRKPSLDRNNIVDSKSSNWIAAVPKTWGDTRRTRAWFRMNVNPRENNWRRTKEDADANEVERSDRG